MGGSPGVDAASTSLLSHRLRRPTWEGTTGLGSGGAAARPPTPSRVRPVSGAPDGCPPRGASSSLGRTRARVHGGRRCSAEFARRRTATCLRLHAKLARTCMYCESQVSPHRRPAHERRRGIGRGARGVSGMEGPESAHPTAQARRPAQKSASLIRRITAGLSNPPVHHRRSAGVGRQYCAPILYR